jgi:hypothetical protein
MGENATLTKYMTLPAGMRSENLTVHANVVQKGPILTQKYGIWSIVADKWIAMDEEFITRIDDGKKNASDVAYRFSVPMKRFMQVCGCFFVMPASTTPQRVALPCMVSAAAHVMGSRLYLAMPRRLISQLLAMFL